MDPIQNHRDLSGRAARICNMRLAACAAPKPLSIFTATKPGAQLPSAEQSAKRPPSATPVPQEGGWRNSDLALPPNTDPKCTFSPHIAKTCRFGVKRSVKDVGKL
jgi:hypothetical protein